MNSNNYFGKIRSFIQDIFSLDTRALAILRIAIGFIIIIDLCVRLRFIDAFHLNTWLLPLDVLRDNYKLENIWSLHAISWTLPYQLWIFGLHFIVASAFLIWRKTKISVLFLRILTLSLHGHNPLVLNGWDTFLRVILFRCLFLPLWQQRSLDNLKAKQAPFSLFSLATVWFICQLCMVYIFSAILKDHPRRTSEFTATYYALSLDSFSTTFGKRLYQFPWTMKFLTASTYILESFWLLLLVIPWRKFALRLLCVWLFISFHIWLWVSLHLYSFPRIMSFAWLTLVPSIYRDKITYSIQSKISWNTIIMQFQKSVWLYQQKFTFFISVFLILCLGYIFMWNLRTTDFNKYGDIFPTEMNRFWFLVRIDQRRNMFAPFPFTDDGRTAIAGIWSTRTNEGEQKKFNLLNHNLPFTLDKPYNIPNIYSHERRRKYYTSMYMSKNSKYRTYGASYLCNKRNSMHPSNPITKIKRYYVLERTRDNYRIDPLQEIVLYEWDCLENTK